MYSHSDFSICKDRIYLCVWANDDEERTWTNIEVYDISDLSNLLFVVDRSSGLYIYKI